MDAAARLLLVDLLCQAYNAGQSDNEEAGYPRTADPAGVLPLSLARVAASDEARRLALPPF